MINILYCGNQKVFDGVLSSALSILKRTKSDEPFKFYMMTMDLTDFDKDFTPISDSQIKFFNEVAKAYNKDNEFIKLDVTDIYKEHLLGNPNERNKYTPYTLIRLLADLMPELPSKMLYLDYDIMANKDITSLYDMDISEYEFAGVLDHYGKIFFYPSYCNAGVLLLNLEKIKQTQLFAKCRELLKEKEIFLSDQTVLNKFSTKKLIIPRMFNEQKKTKNDTVIRHFCKTIVWVPFRTKNIKQWDIEKMHNDLKCFEFDDILEEYQKLKKQYEINNQ